MGETSFDSPLWLQDAKNPGNLGSDQALNSITAKTLTPAGITGATSATRLVGGTATGSPATGTFAIGDVAVAQNGHVFVCTVAGTPGTWVDAGADVDTAFATNTLSLGTAAAAGVATTMLRSDDTILAFDATTPAASAPSDAGTVGVAIVAARRDHQHPREKKQVLQSGITTPSGAINNAETLLLTLPGLVGGTTLAAGSKIRITAEGTCTASGANVPTFTIRAGTLGTTGDASVAAIALAASPSSGTTIAFSVRIDATVRTLGASGTLAGSLTLVNQGTTGLSATATQVVPFTSATLATTTATNLDLTFVTAGATTTCTFQDVTIEVIP